MDHTIGTNRNPIALINILHRYSREDFGVTYLYLPLPKRIVDQEAWAWLETLKSMGAARKRWLVCANQIPTTLRETHADLFVPSPVCFEAYRLYRPSLRRILDRL